MKTKLYMLTEHSPFMMGFVFITKEDRVVIVDGGRTEDLPYLLEIVGKRDIAAWILTHPHVDHIDGFVNAAKSEEIREQIKKVYYNFPTTKFQIDCEGADDVDNNIKTRNEFDEIIPFLSDKIKIVHPDDVFVIDELTFEFLFCGEERFKLPKSNLAINESSVVFKVTAPDMKSILFLGDLGPEGGKELLITKREKLASDIVQMAHHGHSGVGEDVYKQILPKACMWCCPEWLWNEEDIEFEPELWGTMHQRKWMEKLGVKTHYVTKDGTLEIKLFE